MSSVLISSPQIPSSCMYHLSFTFFSLLILFSSCFHSYLFFSLFYLLVSAFALLFWCFASFPSSSFLLFFLTLSLSLASYTLFLCLCPLPMCGAPSAFLSQQPPSHMHPSHSRVSPLTWILPVMLMLSPMCAFPCLLFSFSGTPLSHVYYYSSFLCLPSSLACFLSHKTTFPVCTFNATCAFCLI